MVRDSREKKCMPCVVARIYIVGSLVVLERGVRVRRNCNIVNLAMENVLKGLPDKISCPDIIYPTVTSSRSCNKVNDLFWFTILAQHETNDVILYIHSVHKHWGNTFQRQNYKMRLKQRTLNWINSMQVKKILFTNVFFSWSLCLLNMFPSMVFLKHLYFSGLLT